jgi:hypothetical protein
MRHQFAIGLAIVMLMTGNNQALAATSLADRLAGRLLIDVEGAGAGWYVEPLSRKRYSLGRPEEALSLMRKLGLGISDSDLAAIPEAASKSEVSPFARRLAGRILLAVQQHGEAWYVSPTDLHRYYLGRPADALAVMRKLGLGIASANLAAIPVALPSPEGASYAIRKVTTSAGVFAAKVITLDRDVYELKTVTEGSFDCGGAGCTAKPLLDYYKSVRGAVAAIHGSYFCPPDYASCEGKVYSYLWPAMDSLSGRVTNEDRLKYHERALITATAEGGLHLYRNAKIDFGRSMAGHEVATGETVTAMLGNYPTLVQAGRVVAEEDGALDEKSRTLKSSRGAVGWNDHQIFLVLVSGATVPDTALVMQTLGATEAMNLDGGGTSAMVWQGEYVAGPGRVLPNALVVAKRP